MVKKISRSKKDIRQISKLNIDHHNLADNFFDYTNVVIQKPWGYEYLIYSNNQTAVWLLCINPGFQTSMHAHPNKKTSITILSGYALIETLGNTHTLETCQGLLIDKGVFHSTKVLSGNRLFVLETENPTNKRDLVRFKDNYGRSGEGYEGSKFYSNLDKMLHNNFNYGRRYGLVKKIGDCELTLMRFNNENHFKDHFIKLKPEILAVLSGKIISRNKCLADTGDIFGHDHLLKHKEFYLPEENEFLFIKKTL